jgi:hypothetical protein
MAMRPNFQELTIMGDDLIVSGQSDDDPLPEEIRVFIEQDGQLAKGAGNGVDPGNAVDRVTTGWTATLSSAGLHTGPALGFGVEIRKGPFEVTSWFQAVTIK